MLLERVCSAALRKSMRVSSMITAGEGGSWVGPGSRVGSTTLLDHLLLLEQQLPRVLLQQQQQPL